MANNHTGNVQPTIDLEEHRSKNVNAKAVVNHGYLPDTDEYVPLTAIDNGDGTYSVISTKQNLAIRADDVTTPDTIYVGYAEIGTASSAAAWRIKKIDTSSYPITTWADSNDAFDNVYDDRASLTYA